MPIIEYESIEAVGEDSDGKIKPIEDLLCKSMEGVDDDKARRTACRWYRIDVSNDLLAMDGDDMLTYKDDSNAKGQHANERAGQQ